MSTKEYKNKIKRVSLMKRKNDLQTPTKTNYSKAKQKFMPDRNVDLRTHQYIISNTFGLIRHTKSSAKR
jgi:hypothetical protein